MEQIWNTLASIRPESRTRIGRRRKSPARFPTEGQQQYLSKYGQEDTVITGSYNFSRSAEFNAENILFIESAALAETYSQYIDHLIAKYRQ